MIEYASAEENLSAVYETSQIAKGAVHAIQMTALAVTFPAYLVMGAPAVAAYN